MDWKLVRQQENLLILYFRKSHNTSCLSPKILHTVMIVFDFSWDIKMTQEKSKTMSMQIFGGKRGVLWDLQK